MEGRQKSACGSNHKSICGASSNVIVCLTSQLNVSNVFRRKVTLPWRASSRRTGALIENIMWHTYFHSSRRGELWYSCKAHTFMLQPTDACETRHEKRLSSHLHRSQNKHVFACAPARSRGKEPCDSSCSCPCQPANLCSASRSGAGSDRLRVLWSFVHLVLVLYGTDAHKRKGA